MIREASRHWRADKDNIHVVHEGERSREFEEAVAAGREFRVGHVVSYQLSVSGSAPAFAFYEEIFLAYT